MLRRSARLGLAYGLAATVLDQAFGAARMMDLNIPSMPGNQVRGLVIELGLGLVLGILATPLVRAGEAAVVVACAVAWTILAYVVAPDPALVPMWATPPVGALLLMGIGAWLGKRSAGLSWILGIAAAIATVVVPTVAERARVRTEAAAPAPSGARAGAPDVMVVVLDTVRAASTSAYGYSRPTTPTLERLAAQGTLFLDATAPSTWSLPSHGSLFTGLFPSGHRTDGDHRILDTAAPTLAEVFARNGYDTRCFTANPHISDSFGLTRGFRWSDRAYLQGGAGRSFAFIYRVLDLIGISADDKGGSQVAGNLEQWLAERPAEGPPTFTFINFLEAHFPYHQVPDEFLRRFTDRSRRELRAISLEAFGAQFGRTLTPEQVEAARGPSIDMYDAGVLYSDHLLSRVVTALERTGRLDRTVLIVLADHGEMVGEHGLFGHGTGLYEPGVRVPLLIRYPGRIPAGVRVTQPVSTLGVFATALDLAGLEPPLPVHAGSLVPGIAGGAPGEPILVERAASEGKAASPAPLGQAQWRYRIYRSGSWKLAQTSNGDTFLFDLASDPEERQNVANTRASDLTRLKTELAAWVTKLGLPALDAIAAAPGSSPPVDQATHERLKALGYTE